jgi:2-haloacid dehalogenase
MTDQPAVKALIYDVFGTVVDWRRGIAREAEACLGPKGYRLDWEAFADAWRGRYQPSMERIRKGERAFTRLDILHRENLLEILPQFGIAGLGETEIDHLNRAWHRLPPWPDAVPGLLRLKTKFIVGTQSNGNIALMVNMAKHSGLPWDVILGAEVVQAYKPMPEAYTRACEALMLPPDRVMMVAAHNNDLLAARKQGLRTAFVARPLEYGTKNPKADIEPAAGIDVAAWSFTELAEKLGC